MRKWLGFAHLLKDIRFDALRESSACECDEAESATTFLGTLKLSKAIRLPARACAFRTASSFESKSMPQ